LSRLRHQFSRSSLLNSDIFLERAKAPEVSIRSPRKATWKSRRAKKYFRSFLSREPRSLRSRPPNVIVLSGEEGPFSLDSLAEAACARQVESEQEKREEGDKVIDFSHACQSLSVRERRPVVTKFLDPPDSEGKEGSATNAVAGIENVRVQINFFKLELFGKARN